MNTGNWNIRPVQDADEWHGILDACVENDLQQTWAYGEAVRDTIDWQPERQLLLCDDQPVAAAQALTRELPVIGLVARLQHGPMFLAEGFTPERATEAVKALAAHWVGERRATLHLCPCLAPDRLPADWIERCGLKPSDEVLWASIRLDLSRDDEALRGDLKRRWRKALNRLERNPLSPRWTDDTAEIDDFIQRYAENAYEKNIPWPSPDLVRACVRSARPGSCRLLWVEREGRPLAGGLHLQYGQTFFGFVSWAGPEAEKLYAQHCVYWEGLRKGRELGCRWYDLGGVDEENLPGITKFKRGTGGEEFAWAGNAERHPEGVVEAARGRDYRQGLGRALPGLDATDSQDDGAQVPVRVAAILGEFVRRSTGIDMELDDQTSLLDGGFLDSLSIVSIVQALQEAFDIRIQPHDITVENFDRLPAIVELVRQKQTGD